LFSYNQGGCIGLRFSILLACIDAIDAIVLELIASHRTGGGAVSWTIMARLLPFPG
jgi:hypothetical protein